MVIYLDNLLKITKSLIVIQLLTNDNKHDIISIIYETGIGRDSRAL